MIKVIKRDGRSKEYSTERIEKAIRSAYVEVYGDDLKFKEDIIVLIHLIDRKVRKSNKDIEVEVIQDIIVDYLTQCDVDVAKAYQEYRTSRNIARESKLEFVNSIVGLIDQTNIEVMTENANKQSQLASTQRDLIAGEVSKHLSRTRLVPKHLNEAEEDGRIKIHDKDYLMSPIHNCELINLDDMLQNGTVINKKKIRKPKSLRTAMTIATQISASVSSSTYGGQTMSLSHLAPFVRIEKERIKRDIIEDFGRVDNLEDIVMKKLKKEIKDSVQLYNYQINTISSTNGQTPFCSLAMYISENSEYEEETALLIEEFLIQRLEGMENEFGIKTTQTFPKLLYFTDENNVTPESKYWYLTVLAAKSTAKRMSPEYISVKKMKELYGVAFPCMGCRSYLFPVIKADGTFDMYGRGNLGVQTINLPYVAIISKGDEKLFFEELTKSLDLCREMGVIRYDKLKGVKARVAPILWQHGAIARLGADEDIIKAINDRNFSVSIGYCGLHETVKYMTGVSLTNEIGTNFGIKVMKFIDDYAKKCKEETGLGFGVYGSPSESTCGWFADKLLKKFGVIEGITNKGYLINSYHVDIREDISAFDKLTLEQKFANYSLSGNITYVEVYNMTKNIEALLQLIKHMYENNIYAEINTESDNCSTCKFDGTMSVDENMLWYCPQCGEKDQEKLSVVRRTCGYISETNWGHSRMLDIINRVKHL